MEKIEHSFLNVNGLSLHIAHTGNGERGTVLFLHGFPEIWYSWRHQMLALSAAGFKCIAPDSRGYGLSDQPPEPESTTWNDLVADIAAILDLLSIPKVFVVGKDFGAWPAYGLALRHPHRVLAVVTLGVPFAAGALHIETLPEGFYVHRWREPDRAEADFGRFDVRRVIRTIYILFSRSEIPIAEPGQEIMDLADSSTPLPPWFTEEDVDAYAALYQKSQFRFPLHMPYRYFGVDIGAIREYAIACGDIEHIRAEIRDFDAFDLRMRLPAVVSKLYKAIKRNHGVTYVHCTAGLGRAPAVALAYMFWIEGYKLNEGHQLLQSRRACFPKLDAIKNATVDMLTGLSKSPVTLMWKVGGCSSVEISGLDIGWGQKIPLKFDKDQGVWILEKELPEGRYEYKYIVDGEWMCNEHELLTFPNNDGHVNNYVKIFNRDMSTEAMNLTTRLRTKNADLTKNERQMVRELFELFNN